ncbi:unnamed protein product, partial [Rangifer tarandus platyrhynchus]
HRPHSADPQVASPGLCGLTGGGSPPRGRVPVRRLPSLALTLTCLPRPVVGRP